MSSKHGLAPFDPAEYLRSDEEIAEYLRALWEDGGVEGFLSGIGDAARAKGMMQIAKEAGVGRESLYKSLSAKGNPAFKTVVKVANALGVKLDVKPITARA